MGFRPIPEKSAKKRPLLPDYGHYMELNLGVFCQINRFTALIFTRTETDGFTGVFWGLPPSPREGEVCDSPRPVSTHNPDLPAWPEECPEKSGSKGEDFTKMFRSHAEDFKKSAGPGLRIPENFSLSC